MGGWWGISRLNFIEIDIEIRNRMISWSLLFCLLHKYHGAIIIQLQSSIEFVLKVVYLIIEMEKFVYFDIKNKLS